MRQRIAVAILFLTTFIATGANAGAAHADPPPPSQSISDVTQECAFSDTANCWEWAAGDGSDCNAGDLCPPKRLRTSRGHRGRCGPQGSGCDLRNKEAG